MKNFTAQSNQKSSGNSCQHERRNSATAAARHSGRNPWLAALECDFRHPADSRKWKARCRLKRQIIRALVLIGEDATEQQISRFQKIPRRTVRWGMALLKAQGLVSNVKKFGLYGPMLRQLHPEKLGAYVESCRTSTRESCRVDSSPKRTSPERVDTAKNAAGDTPKTGAAPAPVKQTAKPTETNSPYRKHTPATAFEAAQRIFRSQGLDAHDAQGLACWIAYRSRCATNEAPRTTTYYIKSADNFFQQYEPWVAFRLIDEGYDRCFGPEPGKPKSPRHKSAAEQRDLAEPIPEPQSSPESKPDVGPAPRGH